MSILQLTIRALALLRTEARIAIAVVVANVLLAGAQFAEPVLFGRIVDRLSQSQSGGRAPHWADVLPLMVAWSGFGIFSVAAAALVALHADRLSHRNGLAVRASFFEHVLHLPASYHSGMHSGRLMKVMHEGANAISGLWLPFLREQCASLATLAIMLPMAIVLNWRLGLLLLVMVVAFGAMIAFVLRRTASMQGTVESYYSELSQQTSDVLGNVPVIQSFTRADSEMRSMQAVMRRLLAAQLPVLSWWAAMTVATRAGATVTVIAIFVLGILLDMQGLATVGEIVTFIGFATALIARLERLVAFFNSLFLYAPKMRDFFEVLDAEPVVRDRPDAVDAGRVGFVAAAWTWPQRDHRSEEWTRWSARPARASRRRWGSSTGCSTRRAGRSQSTDATSAPSPWSRSAATSGWCSRSRCCSPAQLRRI